MEQSEDIPSTAKRSKLRLEGGAALDEGVEEVRPVSSSQFMPKFFLDIRESRALQTLAFKPESKQQLFSNKPVFERVAAKYRDGDSHDSLDEFGCQPRTALAIGVVGLGAPARIAEEAPFAGLLTSERNSQANTLLSTSVDNCRPCPAEKCRLELDSEAPRPGQLEKRLLGRPPIAAGIRAITSRSPPGDKQSGRSILRGDGPHSGGLPRREVSAKKKKVRFSATKVLISFKKKLNETPSFEDFQELILTKRSPQQLSRGDPTAAPAMHPVRRNPFAHLK